MISDARQKDAAALLDDIRRASEEGKSLRDLVRCCVHSFNGPEGIAKELKKIFDAPQQTPAMKQRILADIIKIWLSVEGPGGDEENISLEDVEAQLEEVLEARDAK